MKADDLRLEIDASRRAIQRDYTSLRAELDFVAKTKQAVADHPLPWLGGSAFLGFLLSGRRKPKTGKLKGGEMAEPIKKFSILGLVLATARLLFPIVQPHVTAFVLGKLVTLASRFQR